MEELRAWSSVTTGRQRMIGSRRNVSGRNISHKGLKGRERVSIILLQKVLPTMPSSITFFCSTCGPAALCCTTHVCFDLGQQPPTSQHCQRCIHFFFSYSCEALKMSKYESIKNRLTSIQILLRRNTLLRCSVQDLGGSIEVCILNNIQCMLHYLATDPSDGLSHVL